VFASSIIRVMIEAASTSGTSVNFYQTTWCNNPEDSHLEDFNQFGWNGLMNVVYIFVQVIHFPKKTDKGHFFHIMYDAHAWLSLCSPTGLAGLTLACLYGAYKFKHRGTMSTSVFLMQLRVAAQGTVVACLTAGIGYGLFKDYILKSDEVKKD
jgi:hypothetical protein